MDGGDGGSSSSTTGDSSAYYTTDLTEKIRDVNKVDELNQGTFPARSNMPEDAVKLRGKVSNLKTEPGWATFEITDDTGSIKCRKWSACERDSIHINVCRYVEKSRNYIIVRGILRESEDGKFVDTADVICDFRVSSGKNQREYFTTEIVNSYLQEFSIRESQVIKRLKKAPPQGLHHDEIAKLLNQPLEIIKNLLEYLESVAKVVKNPLKEHYYKCVC